jgi:hypothetical protein
MSFYLSCTLITTHVIGVGSKAILVTVREGPWGSERSRLLHLLGSRLTDGGEIVSLTCRPSFTPRKISGTHFC